MRIAVFCSARTDIPRQYHRDAIALGRWIGENGHTLIYGGLKYSMMDHIATATAAAGGTVIGVVPQIRMADQHPDNTVNIHVETLHERKQTMEENADTFVALEGGIGTLDEILSTLASTSFTAASHPTASHTATSTSFTAASRMANRSRSLATLPATPAEPPIIHILNRDGLYDHLLDLLHRMAADHLVSPAAISRLRLHPDLTSLLAALQPLTS